MRKRLLSLILVFCMVLGMIPVQSFAAEAETAQTTTATQVNPFKDVKQDNWFYDAALYAYENGLFSGTSTNTFSPNDSMTRGMFVTVLGRMVGVDVSHYTAAPAFTDVKATDYYAPYVAWAAEQGITTGVGNGRFDPTSLVSRQQMATFIVRLFDTYKYTYPEAIVTGSPKDMDKVADYAKDTVQKLWACGLFKGDTLGNFNPNSYTSRAEAATILMRSDKHLIEVGHKEPNSKTTEETEEGSTTTYYEVKFELGNGEDGTDVTLPETKPYASGTAITTLPTPFKRNTVFLGWYYDSDMTKTAKTGDTVTQNMTLYAKLSDSAVALAEGGTPDYVSSVDVESNFVITLSGSVSKEDIKVINISNGNEDVTSSVTVSSGVVSGSWKAGQTYQLEILNDNVSIVFNGERQDSAIRYYNFTTVKDDVLNLKLNKNLIYIHASEVGGMPENAPSGLYSAALQNGTSSIASTTGTGSFTYDKGGIVVGDTVAIYADENPAEQAEAAADSGDVAYLTITKVEGQTYSYTVADAEDVLFTPDVLPVISSADTDGEADNNSITVSSANLDFSGDQYSKLGLDSQTTVDVGDYIAFYTGEYGVANSGAVTYYAQITDVKWSGNKATCTITYIEVDQSEVLAAMDAYGTQSQEVELSDEEKARLEADIEQQALESGFAEEAAQYLAALAMETDGFQSLSDDMDLQSYSFTMEDGTPLTEGTVTLMDASKVSIKGLTINATITNNLQHFKGSTGLRAALSLSFKIIVAPGSKNQIEITVTATFEQEVLLSLNVSGDAMWKWAWIIPYIYDYRINANIDVGTYTGVGITATAQSKSVGDEKWKWGQYKVIEDLGLQIQELMAEKEKFLGENVDTVNGGLADKYARMLENEADWVELINVSIFKMEGRALFGLLVFGVEVEFVVSANMNITVGMTFQYASAKRYNFSIMLFHKQSSNNTIDLEPEHYQFDFYVMGTLGIRAGIRLTVYAGLIDKNFARIGITAEAGAYAQLWGYFYYSLHWDASGKTSSYSGALLVEVGIYLEIKFLASALGGTLSYNPTLYEKTWPLWSAGDRQNIQGFSDARYDELNYDLRSVKSLTLPTSLFDMKYMDMTSGEVYGKKEKDGSWSKNDDGEELPAANYDNSTENNYIISFSDPRFSYDPATNTVTVTPNVSDALISGEMTIIWKNGSLAFTSKPLSRTVFINWSDPANARYISFSSTGGSAIKMISTAANATITWPQDPTKQGYTFAGWYTDSELKNQFAPVSKMPEFTQENKGIILYAKWEAAPNSYTVEVYEQASNGAYVLVKSETINQNKQNQSIRTGDTATTHLTSGTLAVARDGFVLNETRTDKTKLIASNGSTVAKVYFDRRNYEVTYHYGKLFDKDNEDTKPVVYKYKYGASVYAPNIVMGGYIFKGWKTAIDGGSDVTFTDKIMGTSDVTYYAQWEASTDTPYRVEYYVQDTKDDAWYYQTAASGVGVTGTPVNLTDYINPTTGLKEGRVTVDGNLVTDSNKADLLKIKGSGNMVVKIYYDRETYPVSFQDTGDSTVAVQTIRHSGKVVRPADPQKAGYTFSHWCTNEGRTNNNCSNAWNFDTQITEAVTLYAAWMPNSNTAYKVEYYEMGTNGNYPTTATSTANKTGTTDMTVTAETTGNVIPNGFTFDSTNTKNVITGNVVGNGSLVLKVYLKRNQYKLTFDANGGIGGTSTDVYNGAAITAPTVTRDGYNFNNWSPAVLATMPIGDTTYIAQWTGWNYKVAYNANLPAGITLEPGNMLDQSGFVYGVEKSLNPCTYVLPGTGYTFAGWSTNKDATTAQYSDNAQISIKPDRDNGTVTLYAIWRQGARATYTVKHSFMNLDGTTYTVDASKTETLTGVEGAYTSAVGKTVEGFTAQAIVQQVAESTGTVITVQYTRNQYTLNWDLNGGTATGYTTGTVYYGASITKPEVSKTGFTFAGWYQNAQLTGEAFTDTTMPVGSRTLYAKWTAKSHTVTINNGGTGGTATGNYTYAETVTLTSGTKSGYRFTGWSSGDVSIQNNSFVMPDNAVTVTANWERIVSTVTWNLAGGTVLYNSASTTGPVLMTADSGTSVTKLADPTRTGYRFTGWDTTIPTTMPENNMTITAKWEPIKVTLTLNEVTGAVVGTVKTSYTIDDTSYLVGSVLTVNIPTPSKTGYTFKGWTISGSGNLTAYNNGDQTLTIDLATLTANTTITLTAGWTINTYPFTLKLDGGTLGGQTSDIAKTHTYGTDTDLSSLVPTKTNYTFLGWYYGSDKITNIAGDQQPKSEYTAMWERNTHMLTINAGGVGATVSGSRYSGEVVTLDPGANQGYNFKGWSVNSGGVTITNNSFTMPDKSVSVSAEWEGVSVEVEWNINFSVSGETAPSPVPSTSTKVGASISDIMPALTTSSYHVEEWYMDPELTNRVTTVPAANEGETIILYAKWVINTYTVTLNLNGGTGSTSTTVTHGQYIRLPSTPKRTSFYFRGYFNGSTQYIDQYGYGFVQITGDITLTAKWDYGIIVAGVGVNDTNYNNVLGDGKISYDQSTHTLTLRGTNITSNPSEQAIFSERGDNLTIVVENENTFTAIGHYNGTPFCGLKNYARDDGNLTITGSGKLTFDIRQVSGAGNTYGLDAGATSNNMTLTIDGPDVVVLGREYSSDFGVNFSNLVVNRGSLFAMAGGGALYKENIQFSNYTIKGSTSYTANIADVQTTITNIDRSIKSVYIKPN